MEHQNLANLLGKAFKGTIISDPVLEPFFIIRYIGGGFGVVKKQVDKTGDLRARVISYPSTFLSCLNYIGKEHLNEGEKEFSSIQEYIETWDKISTRIVEAYKDWKVEKI